MIGDVIDIASANGLIVVYDQELNGYSLSDGRVLSRLVYKKGKLLISEDKLRELVKSFVESKSRDKMKEISKKEFQAIYRCLIQSAYNNEKRLCGTLSIMTEELDALQVSDFDRGKEIRTQMLSDLTKEGEYIDRLIDIAKRIKQMEQE